MVQVTAQGSAPASTCVSVLPVYLGGVSSTGKHSFIPQLAWNVTRRIQLAGIRWDQGQGEHTWIWGCPVPALQELLIRHVLAIRELLALFTKTK